MAQGVPIGSPPVTTAAVESSRSAFKYPSKFPDYANEGDADQFMTHELEPRFSALSVAAQRQAQEAASLSAVGNGVSRNLVSARHESNHHGPFRDLNYGTPASAIHSQRPSLAGSSFPTHSNMGFDQSVAQQNQDHLAESLGMMGLDSAPNGALNGVSYSDGQGFQFNPGSQPWETPQGYGTGFARDTYTNGTGFEKRGSIVGRNSPAGSAYHGTGGLNSPRSFTGTPQPNADPWSRPVSRNPRMSSDLDRRALGQYFLQQPAAPFHPNAGYYSQNYQQIQAPYGAYTDPRHPPHMAGYSMPMPPYALGPGNIPTRPARDQDPGKAFRSTLLDEFINVKSTKGWELKVRSHHGLVDELSECARVD